MTGIFKLGLLLQILFISKAHSFGDDKKEVYRENLLFRTAVRESTDEVFKHQDDHTKSLDALVIGTELITNYLANNPAGEDVSKDLHELLKKSIHESGDTVDVCLSSYGFVINEIAKSVIDSDKKGESKKKAGNSYQQAGFFASLTQKIRNSTKEYRDCSIDENSSVKKLRKVITGLVNENNLLKNLRKDDPKKTYETHARLNGQIQKEFQQELDIVSETHRKLDLKVYKPLLAFLPWVSYTQVHAQYLKGIEYCRKHILEGFQHGMNEGMIHRFSLIEKFCKNVKGDNCLKVFANILKTSYSIAHTTAVKRRNQSMKLFDYCIQEVLIVVTEKLW